jgi:hypothetical protein
MLKNLMSSGSLFALALMDRENEGGAPAAGDPPAGSTPPAAGDGPGEGDGGDPPAGEGDGGEASGDGEEGDGGDPPAEPAARADWRDREIGRKHAQLQAEKRERARLERELADAQALLARTGGDDGGDPPAAGRTPPAGPVLSQADVHREAEKIVAKNTYDTQCNDAYEKGKGTYGAKWDTALSQLQVLGGLGENDQAAVEMMTNVLAADDPAKVLYTLGSNPDEYHRVMALPPARRTAELIKLGMPDKPKPKPRPSGAPDPVEPLTRRANADNTETKLYDDKTSDDEWYAIRRRQKAERWAAKQGKGRAA